MTSNNEVSINRFISVHGWLLRQNAQLSFRGTIFAIFAPT